ncbi:peptidase U61 [Vulcanimicrobium alpinum]|uniref:Peptidase U61 n=1 Tax=Vulcanimicrobium alpinum TaxID=3016050 RepID=A0AAN2C9Z5_UNVUL|nr:LD-carboxypeptidase [Vulcanimicrobium alpinum]BDE06463.1 peptidase U61 [Vulcanimicrobium alpinum]
MNRADFIGAACAAAASAGIPAPRAGAPAVLKAPRLRPGDAVGLVAPSGPMESARDLQHGLDQIALLGLRPVIGKHAMDKLAYLAGSDAARADDINTFARDPTIRGIFALRGGYGAMRILDLIDYAAFAADPKVVFGFSDVTALLNAVTARTGLVTFHGPVAAYSTYTPAVVREILAAVMSATPIGTLHNETAATVVPGIAHGRLVGGNLTLVSALAATPYAIPYAGNILFLEDVHEEPYRIDQMLTTLMLAGLLQSAAGIAVGAISEPNVKPEHEPSPELAQTLRDRLTLARRPAARGLQFGHILDQWIVPIGLAATLDATACTLSIGEAAVT